MDINVSKMFAVQIEIKTQLTIELINESHTTVLCLNIIFIFNA